MKLTLWTFFPIIALVLYGLRSSSSDASSCALDFKVLLRVARPRSVFVDIPTGCKYALEGMRIVRAHYLRSHDRFLPPPSSAKACWAAYRDQVSRIVPNFDIELSCGYHSNMISMPCMNISSRSQFEKLIPEPELKDAIRVCKESLESSSKCASCMLSLSSLEKYLHGPEDCNGYPYIYADALVNRFGPNDKDTTKCFFLLNLSSPASSHHIPAISGAAVGCFVGVLGAASAVALFLRKHKRRGKKKKTLAKTDTFVSVSDHSGDGNAILVKYKFEEIRRATMNFSTENLIGKGGYGNVYKGILDDGSEIAVKRFKNTSQVWDNTFTQEIEAMASVRHVNLVALRGYCTTSNPLNCHQKMIVSELMPKGSLHDHLFGSKAKLAWPIRQKIALGTARGLDYLHWGAQPVIIHRDIKSSNIVLDDNFEPKLADFGLAKFSPKEMTLLVTDIAGTMGYVAPEYAMYGKLTKGSDVYSFGVVLLELLSGKKAVFYEEDGRMCLLADWGWSLVREGRWFDVTEKDMPEMGLLKVMEQHVIVAVHCCHPHLYARLNTNQIVKVLEKLAYL